MSFNSYKYIRYKSNHIGMNPFWMRGGNTSDSEKMFNIVTGYQPKIVPSSNNEQRKEALKVISNQLAPYVSQPSGSLFNELNNFNDNTGVSDFAKKVNLNQNTLTALLNSYSVQTTKFRSLKYHTKMHAFNTCYAAKVLWEGWVAPKIKPELTAKSPLIKNSKEICLLAAFAHDVLHDGSTNPTVCARCPENKTCEIWKTVDTCPDNMEKIQAIKAAEIAQKDTLFTIPGAKDIYIKAIEHTLMRNHNSEMESIVVNLPEVNESNIGLVIQYIVHAADLIGQALPITLSLRLGKLIDEEIALDKALAKAATDKTPLDEVKYVYNDVAFKNSQIWFLTFFQYTEFWIRLIKCFDYNYQTPLSKELMYNIVTNINTYIS